MSLFDDTLEYVKQHIDNEHDALSLLDSLEELNTGWADFFVMLEREGLKDLLIFKTNGPEITFQLDTPYRANSEWAGEEEYFTFMKVNIMRQQPDGSYLFFNANNLNSIYGTHSGLTRMILKYAQVQNVITETEGDNPLKVYSAVVEEIIKCLREEFKTNNTDLDKEKLISLLILTHFQDVGALASTSVEALVKLVCEYKDLRLMSHALNSKIYAANNFEIPSEEFMEASDGLPTNWIVSILKEETD